MKNILICLLILASWTEISAQQVDPVLYKDLKYRNVGPNRGGRATAVCGVINDDQTYYMGATGGGVWKTTDAGITWNNVSDGYFSTPSIGDIQVSQADPNIIYVGTGSDGLRSNVIAGKGMYKSMDAGDTWTHIGLDRVGQIGAVEVHPTNPDIAYVAAIGQAFNPNPERGVYRTKNGGQSWEQVLFISDSIGVSDIEFKPNDPNTIYATLWKAERKPWTIISGGYHNGGIYKSIDGGDTWNSINDGLPIELLGKIDLAVSADDPERIYALVEAPAGKEGLYRSDDGATWKHITSKKSLTDRPFYYCNIEADPTDADIIYNLATRFEKSTDGGEKWQRQSTPHGDNHDMWINPDNPLNYVQCNDGGANVTFNGGKTWTTQFNQATAELYQVEVDDQTPYWLYAGQQDNYSTIAVPSMPPYSVQAGGNAYIINTGGCETGPAVPKPGNPNIVYSNCKGRFGVFNKLTGQEQQYYVGAMNIYGTDPKDLQYRFQRVAPIHVSPHDPDVVYFGSQYVHRTTDDGQTWERISPDLTAFEADKQYASGGPITRDVTGEEIYSTVYSIQESKIKKGQIWVGSNDGLIQVTNDGGKNWKDVTPKDLPPGGRVDSVEPSSHDADKAYCTILRYQLGDWTPYIYRTTNGGKKWSLITDGIDPGHPVRVLREDYTHEGLLFAGTEYGMYVSFDDGDHWQAFQQNLPITPITDIKVHQDDLVLSTMGRGFWIMDNIDLLRKTTKAEALSLYPPKPATRSFHRGSNSIPEYPRPSAVIDYYLPEDATTGVTLKISSVANPKLILREFRNIFEIKDTTQTDERNMQTEFRRRGITSGLGTEKGMHRFRWDMRHYGEYDEEKDVYRGTGPMVAPGNYILTLTYNGQSVNQSIEVMMDPKVKAGGMTKADLHEQEMLSLKIRDLRNDINALSKQIKKKMKNNEALEEIYSSIQTKEGRYEQPMLSAQVRYLYFMLQRADQRPGQDAYQRYDQLKAWYTDLMTKTEAILNTDD